MTMLPRGMCCCLWWWKFQELSEFFISCHFVLMTAWQNKLGGSPWRWQEIIRLLPGGTSSSGISQLCAGEQASLSPIDRAEMPFMARLFLPLYFCPSCCQEILAGTSKAVWNQHLVKSQAGWALTSSMERHQGFSAFLLLPGLQPELSFSTCEKRA